MTRIRQRPLFASREQALNISASRLAARTNRSLRAIRDQIERIFRPWCEIDNSVSGATDELLEALDTFENHIRGSVEWLKMPPD